MCEWGEYGRMGFSVRGVPACEWRGEGVCGVWDQV